MCYDILITFKGDSGQSQLLRGAEQALCPIGFFSLCLDIRGKVLAASEGQEA